MTTDYFGSEANAKAPASAAAGAPAADAAVAGAAGDAATGEAVLTLRGHSGTVMAVEYSPDGSRLASGSHDTTVRVWDQSQIHNIRSLRIQN